jgi:GNAT superfamily N-acetyltransferase
MQTELSETQPRKRSPRLIPDGLSFRMAETADIPQLLPLSKEFFDLSSFSKMGIEYSEANVERYLTLLLDNMFAPSLLALVDDKIVGWCQFQYDMSAFKKPVAVLNQLFVTKKHRRSVIGRTLLTTAMEIAKDEQACAFIAPVNSGSEHIHSLGNLLAKGGFKMTGYIMTRSL